MKAVRLKYSVLVLLCSFISSLNAGFWDFSHNVKVAKIKPDTRNQQGFVKKEGDNAIFSGEICFTNSSYKNRNGKCDLLKNPNFEVHAYFPDPTTEVTEDLKLEQEPEKGGRYHRNRYDFRSLTGYYRDFHYEYVSPEIIKDNTNSFTLIVGEVENKCKKLLKVKGKFVKRLHRFYSMLKDHKRIRGKGRERIERIVSILDKANEKINEKIDNQPGVLARIEQPILVENNKVAKYERTAYFEKYELKTLIDRGLPFGGEDFTIDVNLKNTKAEKIFPIFKNDFFEGLKKDDILVLRAYLNGSLVHESKDLDVEAQEEFRTSLAIEGLNANHSNDLKISIFKMQKFWRHEYEAKIAEFNYDLDIVVDEVSPEWSSESTPQDQISYYQDFPSFSFSASDSFGRFLDESFSAKISYEEGEQEDVPNFSLVITDDKRLASVTGLIEQRPEGKYSLEIELSDTSGNFSEPNPLKRTIFIDRTKPVLAFVDVEELLTNVPQYDFNVSILDDSPTTTQVLQNDVVILETTEKEFSVSTTLHEGFNTFKVQSIDAAGNIADTITSPLIELDTIPPALSNVMPSEGDIVNTLAFSISGNADEELSFAKIYNIESSLSGSSNFNLTITAPSEGDFSYSGEIYDLAGNKTEFSRKIQVILKVLNQDLISINPSPTNSSKVLVSGIKGASRPGIEITLDAGFFNTETTVSNEDGSFEIEMDFFNSVKMSAYDSSLGRGDSFTLNYNVDTTFSGLVMDYQGEPLPNVKVTIQGSGQSTYTDGSGAFAIADPQTGDQKVQFDGSEVPESNRGLFKVYGKTNITTSIGARQQNLLSRPIYLTPTIVDGTETNIADENSSVIVTHPDIEDFSLNVPAGVATFPNGGKSGDISVLKIAKEFTTVPPAEFAEPDNVYALEPSGLTFSEPVELTLPNVNEFPEGMELVIMSKNSENGMWEIDGSAVVESGGSFIKTKEGMGITHFSEVYAAPVGPKIYEFGGSDKPGADSFNGAMSTSLSLPSYKSLGRDITSSLVYNSQWASPSVVVSNVFDIPRQEVKLEYLAGIEGGVGRRVTTSYKDTVWIEPEKIEASFITGDFESNKIPFTGMPNKSVISYSLDLPQLESGVHPYIAQYEVHLKQMILRTITQRTKKSFGFGSASSTVRQETLGTPLEDVFPTDVAGSINIQNKVNSPLGTGWKIGGVQRILNPSSERILIEEGNGATSSFVVDNIIETVYHDSTNGLRSFTFGSDENLRLVDQKRILKSHNLTSNTTNSLATVPYISGSYYWNGAQEDWPGAWFCYERGVNFTKERYAEDILSLPNGNNLIIDKYGSILLNQGSSMSNYAGTIDYRVDGYYKYQSYFCNREGIGCGNPWVHRRTAAIGCWWPFPSPSPIQNNGYRDGSASSSQFNHPRGVTAGFSPSSVVIADYGNNLIRKINLNTNQVTTIAGNRQTYDNGDGGHALNASIYHPNDVIYDSTGNLYITTERGYIRKVSPDGTITRFGGLPSGGILADEGDIRSMRLNNPYGMAIDEDNGYFYVADSGNNRILQIDLETYYAKVIAGSGNCINGDIGDDGPALAASLCSPNHIELDEDRNLYVLDKGHGRIRKIHIQLSTGTSARFAAIGNKNDYLERIPSQGFILHYRNGSKSYFNLEGLQTSMVARNGHQMSYSYDSEGNLLSMTDPVGSVTNYNYSGGKLSSILDPAGRETLFQYSGNNLSKVVFPDGSNRDYVYNSKGIMLSEKDQRGQETKYHYNEWSRLASVTKPDNTNTVINDFKSSTIGNSFSSSELKSLEDEESVDGIKDAKGNETLFKKDESGFVSTITDASGKVTSVERDLKGKPTKIIRPDGSIVEFTYNSETDDLVEKVDSGTGANLEWSYDSYGNLLSQMNAAGQVSLTNEYYNNGLIKKKTNILGQSTQYSYNSLSLVSSVQNSLGQVSSYEYSEFGNLLKTTASDGAETLLERDAAGNVTQITNALGQITKRTYDSFNRLTSVTTPKNETTSYQYLATGELSKIIDPIGNETTFEYNSMGRMIKKTDPLGNITNVSYDNNGNVTQEIDPNGNIKTFTYNELDQMTRKSLPDNTYLFEYDIRGNMLAVEDNNSLIEFEYVRKEAGDLVSNVSFEGKGDYSDMGAYQLEMVYDVLGNRTALGTPIGEYQYDYDIGSRLVKISNHKLQEFAFGYDSGNRLTAIASPKHSTDFEFDNTNFLTQIMHTNLSNSVLTSFAYSKDAIGNRVQKRTPAGNFDYGYDSNNQLTSASNPEASSESFNYDALGNRLQDSLGQYLYDTAKQRIQEDYRFLYTFDNNGNLTTKIEKTNNFNFTNFEYNSQNQLIKIKKFEDNVLIQESSYAYDALGRRMEKVVDHKIDDTKDFTRRFGYDGNELLFETDENNEILASYTQSTLRTDDPLAINITTKGQEKGRALASGDYYYLKDGLGSVTDIINDSGELIQHYIYSSFGELLKVENGSGADITTNPSLDPYVTYTSREHDKESGLYYYRARYYVPALGQFLTADPHPGKIGAPLTYINKYIYASNVPTLYSDSSGHSFLGDLGKGVIGALLIMSPTNGFALLNTTDSYNAKDTKRFNKIGLLAVLIGATIATGGTSAALSGQSASAVSSAAISEALMVGGSSALAALGEEGNYLDNFLDVSIVSYGGAIVGNGFNRVLYRGTRPSHAGSILGFSFNSIDVVNVSVGYFSWAGRIGDKKWRSTFWRRTTFQ